jgi:hypothetical protein
MRLVSNETLLYSYHLSGRRPGTFIVLTLSLTMLAFAARYADTRYFLLPVGLASLMALWAIATNPQSGATLSNETLRYYNRGPVESVQIKDIASMKISSWSDGPDTVTLNLKSGRVVHVPNLSADSKLAVALRSLGITEN